MHEMIAAERFERLVPVCQKAIKKALWHCQEADQDDAIQIGLIEVWKKLNAPETAGNTDSWFITRATLYAREYAHRMIYRHQERHISYTRNDEEGSSAGGNVTTREPASTAQIDQAEAQADYQLLTGRLTESLARCAWLLANGWNKAETAHQLGISRDKLRQHMQKLQTALR